MAQVHPFRGVRYAAGTDYARVVTPPYDVIDPTAQRAYHDRDPHNIIRLELGYEHPGDTPGADRYTRAAATFGEWLAAGVLVPEAQPALYLYEEDFAVADRRYLRTSFFAAVAVTDYGPGRVMPHEHTLASPVEDRYRLLSACRANFSPIFGLHPDPDGAVAGTLRAAAGGRSPDVRFTDDAGTHHRLWAVTDLAATERVQQLLAPVSIYIADGHHRYETARRYFRGHADQPGADRVLMVLSAFADPGLVVLPTHRVVSGLRNHQPEAFLAALATDFSVTPWSGAGSGTDWVEAFQAGVAAQGRLGLAMGLYLDSGAYVVQLKNEQAIATAAPEHSAAWHHLDVAVLQTLILDRLLGIGDRETSEQKHLLYTRDARDAVARVQSGQAQMAFLMNPLPVTAVTAVADARDHMPPKSTYFYPKFLTGLVLHRLESNGAPG